MKKYLVCSLLAIAVAMSGTAFAAEGAKPKKSAAAEKAKTHQLTGEITALDAAAGTLTVKGKDGDKSFKTDAATKVATADKKEGAALADLKVGDKVLVIADEAGVAKKISPAPAPAKKKKAE